MARSVHLVPVGRKQRVQVIKVFLLVVDDQHAAHGVAPTAGEAR